MPQIIDIPERTGRADHFDPPDNWNAFVGATWLNVFKLMSLPKEGRILEIAPGKENKIGIGLELLGFEGMIHIVEPSPEAMTSIVAQYRQRMPKAKLIRWQCELKDVPGPDLFGLDMVVANHPLDDMILGKFLDAFGMQDYFGLSYGLSAERTRRLWNQLAADAGRLANALEAVAEEWIRLIELAKPKKLAIFQYPSYYFETQGIWQPDEQACQVLECLRERFFEYTLSNSLLEGHSMRPERWLMLDFRR